MELIPEEIIKIILALLAGGLIGLEREIRDKAAGFRTLIMICVGAALFTMLSNKLAGDNDTTRIAAQIVSGVGFLGAGVILREGGRVIGLTTAATIWFTAALGMGIGGGAYLMTGAAAALMLIVLWIFPSAEHWIDRLREERTYWVSFILSQDKYLELEKLIHQCGLKILVRRQAKLKQEMQVSWHVRGSMAAHEHLIQALYADTEIKEFHF